MKSKTTFVFDLDGTLIDSFDDVFNAMNVALKKCGFTALSKEDIRQLIGPDLAISITNKINSDRFSYDEFIKNYRNYYTQANTIHTALYGGVREVLEALTEQGKTLAVLTNKPESQAKSILFDLDIGHFFKVIAGPDTYDVAKPDPAGFNKLCEDLAVKKEDVVFIGDTEIDMMTANNADVTSVAVTYGYRSTHELKEYNPHFIIASLPHLLTLNLD